MNCTNFAPFLETHFYLSLIRIYLEMKDSDYKIKLKSWLMGFFTEWISISVTFFRLLKKVMPNIDPIRFIEKQMTSLYSTKLSGRWPEPKPGQGTSLEHFLKNFKIKSK